MIWYIWLPFALMGILFYVLAFVVDKNWFSKIFFLLLAMPCLLIAGIGGMVLEVVTFNTTTWALERATLTGHTYVGWFFAALAFFAILMFIPFVITFVTEDLLKGK